VAGKLTIVATPHFVVRPDQLARLKEAHPRVTVHFVTTLAEFATALPEADGTVTGFGLTPELLQTAPRLRWLQVMGAGVERVLTPEIVRSNLIVTASKGPMGVLMAEHVVAMMLALARDFPCFAQDQRDHRWRRFPAERGPLLELAGKTIFVLGLGAVGGEVARICKLGFRMRVLGLARRDRTSPHVDCFVERGELPRALAEADFVSLCLPTTASTRAIVDAAALAAMKPGAYLINVARAQLVDEPALIAALQEGRLAGAGLDAFSVEPLPADSPFWSLPNVIITPHTSAITDRLGDHFVDFWCENVRRFADGEPMLGLVDKEAGY
jgi:phosphoglycerate dehydrogenase-like enzyme